MKNAEIKRVSILQRIPVFRNHRGMIGAEKKFQGPKFEALAARRIQHPLCRQRLPDHINDSINKIAESLGRDRVQWREGIAVPNA